MAGFYAALRRQNDAAPLADYLTALHTRAMADAKLFPYHAGQPLAPTMEFEVLKSDPLIGSLRKFCDWRGNR